MARSFSERNQGRTLIILYLAAVLSGGGISSASSGGSQPGASAAPPARTQSGSTLKYDPGSLIDVFDENRDGAISRQELLDFLTIVDRDGDQLLTYRELDKVGGEAENDPSASLLERLKRYSEFLPTKPAPGDFAPMFVMKDLEGNTVSLAQLLKTGPVLIETGSYSCPVFRRRHGSVEQLAGEFKGKVHLVVLYGREAHPGKKGFKGVRQPTENNQRIKLASGVADQFHIRAPVLVDDVNNKVVDAYGGLSNSGYLIGQDGRVFHKLAWIHPDLMREPLQELLKLGGSGGPNPPAFAVNGISPHDADKARAAYQANRKVSFKHAPVSIAPVQRDQIAWIESNLATAKVMARDHGVPVLIEFHFDGCPVCAAMDNGPLADAEVVSLLRGYVPVRIDLLSTKGSALGEKYGVIGTPTFVLLNSDGEVMGGHEGYLDSADMSAFLLAGLAGD